MNEALKTLMLEISDSVIRAGHLLGTVKSPEALEHLSASLKLQAEALDVCIEMLKVS